MPKFTSLETIVCRKRKFHPPLFCRLWASLLLTTLLYIAVLFSTQWMDPVGGMFSCCDARILSKSEAAAMRMCKQQPGMRRRLRAHARAGTSGLPTAQN